MSEISCQLLADELAAIRADIQSLESSNYTDKINGFIIAALRQHPFFKFYEGKFNEILNKSRLQNNQIEEIEKKVLLKPRNEPLQVNISDEKIIIRYNEQTATIYIQTSKQIQELNQQNKILTEQIKLLEEKIIKLESTIKTIRPSIPVRIDLSKLATKDEIKKINGLIGLQSINNQEQQQYLDDITQTFGDSIVRILQLLEQVGNS